MLGVSPHFGGFLRVDRRAVLVTSPYAYQKASWLVPAKQDDVLVVTKLDRLGRNAIDLATTLAALSERGVRAPSSGAG